MLNNYQSTNLFVNKVQITDMSKNHSEVFLLKKKKKDRLQQKVIRLINITFAMLDIKIPVISIPCFNLHIFVHNTNLHFSWYRKRNEIYG